MAKRTEAVFVRHGYHHGNLKEALVAAACRLIAERGPAGFPLSEAARLAGVSVAAPYRHFKDRDALIAEVARRGFAAFAARLGTAWGGAEVDPMRGFSRMGEAYLAFAREEPGFYGAMFAHGGVKRERRHNAGEGAFAALEHAIARVAAAKQPRAGRIGLHPRVLAYQVWALSHGIATLSAGALLPSNNPALRPENLLRAGVAALIDGADGGKAGTPVKPRREPRSK